MLLLPMFNATLQPCPVGAAEFTAHEKGHFCGSCQRVVQGFIQSTNPVAALAAARAAAPDDRVCGMFNRTQTMAPPSLSRRLRWFLVVLVLSQGLTAREALAQVRKAAPTHRTHPAAIPKRAVDLSISTITVVACELSDGTASDSTAIEGPEAPKNGVYTYVQQMPTFRSGGQGDLVTYIQQQVRQSAAVRTKKIAGRAFVSFTVGKDGVVRDARIVKSLLPLVDAEILRIVRALTGFAPGKQNGQNVAVSLTLPITFSPK